VDPWFIIHGAPEQARLMRSAREVNDAKPHWVIDKVREKADRFKSPKIACLGLAFKANIDDLRESPALEITRDLAGAQVGEILAVEPYVKECPKALQGLPGLRFTTADEAIREADILLLLVDHAAFKTVDRRLLQEKIVIDTRGIWRV
jgi:UDP-N-acetyl-D-mannosaminuronic acid dehydrogenase